MELKIHLPIGVDLPELPQALEILKTLEVKMTSIEESIGELKAATAEEKAQVAQVVELLRTLEVKVSELEVRLANAPDEAAIAAEISELVADVKAIYEPDPEVAVDVESTPEPAPVVESAPEPMVDEAAPPVD